MRARLEGDDHGGAARGVARAAKRHDLGVRLAGRLGVALADDDAALDQRCSAPTQGLGGA